MALWCRNRIEGGTRLPSAKGRHMAITLGLLTIAAKGSDFLCLRKARSQKRKAATSFTPEARSTKTFLSLTVVEGRMDDFQIPIRIPAEERPSRPRWG